MVIFHSYVKLPEGNYVLMVKSTIVTSWILVVKSVKSI